MSSAAPGMTERTIRKHIDRSVIFFFLFITGYGIITFSF